MMPLAFNKFARMLDHFLPIIYLYPRYRPMSPGII